MNTFQIVMLILAAGLVVSVFWDKIKTVISQIEIPKKPNETVTIKPQPAPSTLVEVVAAWEHLKKGCEKHNLNKAVVALKAIFPLFVMEEGSDEDV